eukprot:CAMPEP_0117046812 /NCGR_PEP_ID=MMETSP0472-20121206/32359_1 /TAXON_ID=693140 ORGANISM="Tiarina fusus, Strain LIS" /NCGR_SAMPLE_ID=MMETSP0472 /ASSEMBLY_ACC=CAM_ASM_000603 /LENGTH=76 /DNA_ID=CAMNT_0004759289 /DNA_START=636 /DNA_END=866 /DNA_ORIENTATION=+
MTLRSFNTPNEEPITPTRTVEASISPETELVFIDAEEEATFEEDYALALAKIKLQKRRISRCRCSEPATKKAKLTY